MNFDFWANSAILNKVFFSIKTYPERVKKTMVRQHHCCIFPLRANCNHQYPRACNKCFKTHTTSCKKATEKETKHTIKDLLHQNYWKSPNTTFITERTNLSHLSLVQYLLFDWLLFLFQKTQDKELPQGRDPKAQDMQAKGDPQSSQSSLQPSIFYMKT